MPTMLLTPIPEGNCVMTKVFGSRPKFLLAYKGHELDKNNNVVNVSDWAPNDERWADIQVPPPSDLILRQVGLYPVGLPPRKVSSKMRTWKEWTYLDENGKTTEERRLWVRREETCLFPVMNFPYAFRMKGVETSMGFKIDIDFTVNVEGVNPEIALARHDDWYIRFDGLGQGRARSYIGGKDVFELFTEEKGAQTLLKFIHPLRVIQARREDEARARGTTLPTASPFPPFNEYLATMTVMDENEAGTDIKLEPKPLAQGLGIRVTDATIEDVSISASETKLLEEMSAIIRQDIENVNTRSKAEAKKDADRLEGEGQAAAMNAITASRRERLVVDKEYMATPAGVAIATMEAGTDASVRIAELQTESMKAVAAAVTANQKLTTVVFPNGGAAPVVPVGDNKAA